MSVARVRKKLYAAHRGRRRGKRGRAPCCSGSATCLPQERRLRPAAIERPVAYELTERRKKAAHPTRCGRANKQVALTQLLLPFPPSPTIATSQAVVRNLCILCVRYAHAARHSTEKEKRLRRNTTVHASARDECGWSNERRDSGRGMVRTAKALRAVHAASCA